MASGSSGGGGWIVASILLGITTAVFFVTTFMFYGQINTLKADAEAAQTELTEFVAPSEREAARAKAQQASRDGKSVYAMMSDALSQTMQIVSGVASMEVSTLADRAETVAGSTPLLVEAERQAQRIDQLEAALADARDERSRLEEQLAAARAHVREEQERFSQAQQALQGEIESYSGRVVSHVERLESQDQMMRDRVDRIRSECEAEKAQLQGEITRLNDQLLVLQGQVQQLRRERRDDLVSPKDEFALVDARVLAINATQGRVTIDRGRRDKIVLGLSFAIYSDASAIRSDEEGNYPPGKAVVEVINVDETSSTCRILRETQGNPIVRGDVAANALYDPNKVYTFLVYGNFETDGDGRATPFERDGIEALIKEWNGEVTDELTGEVDFLVLGERPVLPPQPSSGAPVEVLQEWLRQRRIVDRYDELQERAEATSIPILNQNRLRTLTGR